MTPLPTLKALPGALKSPLLAGFIHRKRAVRMRHIPHNIMGADEFKRLFDKLDTAKEGVRLKTYESWPATSPVSVADLAAAGFCYTGREGSDEVVCFLCKGKISQWKYFEVPIRMHCETYPNCEFAKGVAREVTARRGGVTFDAKAGPDTPPFADEKNPSSAMFLNTELVFFGAEFNRLMTLCDCPLLNPVDRYDLAASGFIRPVETEEHTVCVACGLEVKEWVLGDLPQKKHAELRPDCPFVKDRASSNREMDTREKYQFVKRGVAVAE